MTLLFRSAAPILLLALAPFAAAADTAIIPVQTPPPPSRTVSVTVFGEDACPKSGDDEIVVCARLPENERYRLPKRFRGRKAAEQSGAGNSWTNKVSTLETVSRVGTPNSCSPTGSGGMTGCYQQLLRKWYLERQAMKADADAVP